MSQRAPPPITAPMTMSSPERPAISSQALNLVVKLCAINETSYGNQRLTTGGLSPPGRPLHRAPQGRIDDGAWMGYSPPVLPL